VKSTLQYAVYPMEALCARRGVQGMQSGDYSHLIQMLACDVDRVETIPSPYLWNAIQGVEARVKGLEQTVLSLHTQFKDFSSESSIDDNNDDADDEPLIKVTTIIRALNTSFLQVASNLSQIHTEIDTLKHRIRRILQVTGQCQSEEDDPFQLADIQEREEEMKVMGQIRNAVAKAQVMNVPVPQAAPALGQPAPGLFGNTSAPNPAFGFGATNPPAPTTGLFGSSTAPTAPAPAFGFGASTAPAPSTGLFGSSTAPAAPATAFGFGASTAPAPAFGAPSTSAPSTNLFGSTTTAAAPTPPTTNLFGSNPAPAPTAFNFQQPAPAPAFGSSTTKSKSKTRTGRSRR